MWGIGELLIGAGLPSIVVGLFYRRRRQRIQRNPWDEATLEEYRRYVASRQQRGLRKRAEERLEMEEDWRVALKWERVT